ncbi:MAG TPA: bifunctional DNA primase/polymerase [Ktedonobacteraceae bacterium]|nr:bifunctional DNA primase/polymerase [Ktedonobacteraceae bacterium]
MPIPTSFEQYSSERFNFASLGDAALAYASAGIPVLPLKPRDKQPIVAGGFKSATTDLFLVRRWWRETPLANIGVACGEPSGWWVVDIDPRHDGLASLVRLQQDIDRAASEGVLSRFLYSTRRQLTGGGGAHLFFRRRFDLVGKVATATNWAGYTGIDVRGDRSYIVVAPSVHPTGGIYQWQNDLPLVPFPTVLAALAARRRSRRDVLDFAARPERSFRDASRQHTKSAGKVQRNEPAYYLQLALAQAVIGVRNTKACWLGCRLVEDVGLDWDGAVPWMLEYVARVSQHNHPYTEEEAMRALRWAFEQAQSQAA